MNPLADVHVAVELPRLGPDTPIVATSGRGASQEFAVAWQQAMERIEGALLSLEDQIQLIQDAQDAADAANAAAAAANTAAATAQTAADDVTAAQEIGASYVSGATITATDAGTDVTITISAHTRHYPQPDGTTTNVAVNGGNLTGRAYGTRYFIYYDDAARAGGAVTYQSTASEATAAQIGDRHVVGSSAPIAALDPPTGGNYVQPPGAGNISYQ